MNKKYLVVSFLLIISGLVVFSKPGLRAFFLEDSVRSAESANSYSEYKKIKPLKQEPKKVRINVLSFDQGDDIFRAAPNDRNIGKKMARIALKWSRQGKSYYNSGGIRVNIARDCSNFVRSVYHEASGLDLFNESYKLGTRTNSGCFMLYSYIKKASQKFHSRRPRVGDIIFFDNTWDKNRNRRNDDWFTHVGLVTKVKSGGDVEFVHANTGYPRKIRMGKLNINHPRDNRRNTYLRRRYSWDRQKLQMAGQLVRGFGGFSVAGGGSYTRDRRPKRNEEEPKRNVVKKVRKPEDKPTRTKSSGKLLFGRWKSEKIVRVSASRYNPLGHWVLDISFSKNKTFRASFVSTKSGTRYKTMGSFSYKNKSLKVSRGRKKLYLKRFSLFKLISLSEEQLILKVKRKGREYYIIMRKI